jgi:putative thioredoxin
MSTSPHVVDVDLSNFEQVVLLGSRETPVLVDFWATWCGPCKALGPTLEKLADEMAGAFVLAKVDIDRNQEIAQAFRIQSVPTVVLIAGGQPVDAFAGARSYAEVKEFLERHLGPGAGAGPDPVAEARELLAAGELVQAVALLAEAVEADPGDQAARALLALALFEAEDVEGAREHLAALDEAGQELEDARSLRARLDLLDGAGDLEALRADLEAAPADVGRRIEYGRALVAVGRTEEGLDELLEACMRDLHFQDDAPRKALLEVFQALGPQDPLTLEYQQRLSVLLCS